TEGAAAMGSAISEATTSGGTHERAGWSVWSGCQLVRQPVQQPIRWRAGGTGAVWWLVATGRVPPVRISEVASLMAGVSKDSRTGTSDSIPILDTSS
ncbi:hypothetical protein SK226_31760, partial [Pseudomonas aeruginosa]|nr:hypothetical protein [Pseudomonas aeruginosa]